MEEGEERMDGMGRRKGGKEEGMEGGRDGKDKDMGRKGWEGRDGGREKDGKEEGMRRS